MNLSDIRAQLEDELTWRQDEMRLLRNQLSHMDAVSPNCILLIFLALKFIIQFKITIYMLISILYKMNALLISATIPSGEDARTVSPKIRLIDEKKPSTAHLLPY